MKHRGATVKEMAKGLLVAAASGAPIIHRNFPQDQVITGTSHLEVCVHDEPSLVGKLVDQGVGTNG